MLTRRQKELLQYIQSYHDGFGIPPSYDEMMLALGLHSKSGVHRMVCALEERGFIRRIPNRARAIELIQEVPAELRIACLENICDVLSAENKELRERLGDAA